MSIFPIDFRVKLTYHNEEATNLKLTEEIEKNFGKIERLFSETALERFCACEYGELDRYHFSLGCWIRNNLLNKGELPRLFTADGICHRDDRSMLMIRLFDLYIHEKYR